MKLQLQSRFKILQNVARRMKNCWQKKQKENRKSTRRGSGTVSCFYFSRRTYAVTHYPLPETQVTNYTCVCLKEI